MGNYDELETFMLKDHGDRWEREWGHLIATDFPAYAVFWRRYIVPLTNRISATPSRSEREWTRLRPEVSERLEQMTMAHYSVFYYLARAANRISASDPPFPEDVFALLDASGDNLRLFFGIMREILGDLNQPSPVLPIQKPEFGPFFEVQKYRDTILHNPVLGHAVDRGLTRLPRAEVLGKLKGSWRAVAQLGPDQFVDSGDLYKRLLKEITGFLEEKWREIIGALDGVRDLEKFKKQWALQGFLPMAMQPMPNATVINPTSASEAQGSGIAASPTANVPVLPDSTQGDKTG